MRPLYRCGITTGPPAEPAIVIFLIQRPLVGGNHIGIARVLRYAELVEVVVRVQIFILKNIEGGAVIRVGSALGGKVFHAARGAAL